MSSSFFRYPGGKSRLKKLILPFLYKKIEPLHSVTYCEPFFGGGSVGLSLLSTHKEKIKKVVINDRDPAIADLWTSVIREPDNLCEKVKKYVPDPKDFYILKEELQGYEGGGNFTEWGFKKLVLHQISFSGLGTRSGSPQGGKSQNSSYGISCRWSPHSLEKKISSISVLLNEVGVEGDRCYCGDFSSFIRDDCLIYLDPPYLEKGPEIYEYYFSRKDHFRLRDLLQRSSSSWIASYDNHPLIQEMYTGWSEVANLQNVNYSINTSRKCSEIVISSKT